VDRIIRWVKLTYFFIRKQGVLYLFFMFNTPTLELLDKKAKHTFSDVSSWQVELFEFYFEERFVIQA